MALRRSLVPRIRSKNHGLWRVLAAVAGAIAVAGVAGVGALAAANKETGLWHVALVVFVAMLLLGVLVFLVAGVAWIFTRPVREAHGATLAASLTSIGASLTIGTECNYAGAEDRKAAVHAHYKWLGKRFDEWDGIVAERANTMQALRDHISSALDTHGLTAAPEYNHPKIEAYLLAVVLRDAARENAPAPVIVWTSAHNIGAWGGGSLFGVRKPERGDDWVMLTPNDGESEADWLARGDPFVAEVTKFVAATYAAATPLAKAAFAADQRAENYKNDTLPAVHAAIRLTQEREPPRMLSGRRCKTC